MNDSMFSDENNFLIKGSSNVKKYDMEPQIIDYESNKIVSDKLFEQENNVKAEYANHFDASELSALKNSAKNIQTILATEIKNESDVKKKFIEIRSNYIKILKILNRKVKKFEFSDQEKSNLSDFEAAVVDQFEKIKQAIIFFERADWEIKKNWDLDVENKTLLNLIDRQKIEFKLPQLNEVDLESLDGAGGCLNEIKFVQGTDGKNYVLKKDPFVVEKKSMKFNPLPQSSRHRQNKKIGAYGHFESKGQQFIVDGVSRQKGQQTIAKALGLDCIVKTGECLVNGEVYTYMEDAKNSMPGDKYIYYGNQVLFCLNDNECNEAENFINNKTLTVKDKSGQNLNKLNVNQNISMKDFFVAKKVTKKTLIAMSELSILDFICGQFDRHSGNFALHFDKDGNAKFVAFDNDSNFPVNLSDSEMKQILKEKVPIVPKSLILKLLIFGATYQENVKPDLEAQIGKVGDFENGQDSSLAVRETEKRIIMLFNHIFKFGEPWTTIGQIEKFCPDRLANVYKKLHPDTNENDLEKIISGLKDAMLNLDNKSQLMNTLDSALKNTKRNFIDDNEITVEEHGRLFLQLEPDGWFKWLLYKIFDYIKYVCYQKKGNLLSAMHWQTRKYLIEKQFPKVDQVLVLKEENKIKNCKVKKDDKNSPNVNINMENMEQISYGIEAKIHVYDTKVKIDDSFDNGSMK